MREGLNAKTSWRLWASCTPWGASQFENNYFTQMCSGFEAGSYLRLIDFVYHSTLGLRVIQQKKMGPPSYKPDLADYS